MDALLDSFLHTLGPEGTLLLPLFNFDFTTGGTFDMSRTPSHMGALTELARVRSGTVRTGHPVYSFGIIGKHSARFELLNNFSGYGLDSPFALLRELNGKIAVLDIEEQGSMTFYHHVEEMCQVPYRFMKTFTGRYRGRDEVDQEASYAIYVRDLERGVVTKLNTLGERIWSEGLYRGDKPQVETGLRVVEANPLFDFVATLIAQGQARGYLYDIEGSAA